MRAMRFYEIVLVATASISSASCAAAVGTNFSDHWWSPGQPGWGVAIQQQSDVLFVQVLVYAAGGSAVWYIASANSQMTSLTDHSVYSGDLYRTNGPVIAGSFDAAAVSTNKVGTLNFDADTADTAMLSYTIDGVAVSKPITRLTWKLENLAGDYYGGFVYDFSQTHAPCIAGHFEDFGPLTVTQTGTTALVMRIEGTNRTCTFTGDYSQLGHMGTTHGTFLCTQGGLFGTYTGLEIESGAHGLAGRIVGETTFCEFEGSFGGVRR
jgi:hypothetical protein